MVAGAHVLGLATARTAGAAPPGNDPILVLVNLSGGNDALNTVIPLDDVGAPQRSFYESLRPDLAIPTDALGGLGLDPDPELGTGLALHPQCTGLKELFDEGKLALVHGVGLEESSLSHFDAEAVWFTGDPRAGGAGWAGRHVDQLPAGPVRTLSFREPSPTFTTAGSPSLTVGRVDRFSLPDAEELEKQDLQARRTAWHVIYRHHRDGLVEEAAASGATLVDTTEFFSTIEVKGWGSRNEDERTSVGRDFLNLASILRHDVLNPGSESGLRFFHVRRPGFDSHSSQGTLDPTGMHPGALGEVSRGVTAFQRDVEALGLADRVVTILYSEFGRRVRQNDEGATAGTDHGRGGLLMAVGSPVNGGHHGGVPRLDDLDGDGNLRSHTDFRRVYASVIDDWLGGDHTGILLDAPYTKLPLFS